MELISEYDDEFFEGYDVESCGAAVARAYGRMFRQVAFIGREAEGGLIGYWLRDGVTSVAEAPIIVLDSEGQFACTAVTSPDHFVQAPYDDPDAVASIRRWVRRWGIATERSAEAVWAAIKGLPDPNALSRRFQGEESPGDSKT